LLGGFDKLNHRSWWLPISETRDAKGIANKQSDKLNHRFWWLPLGETRDTKGIANKQSDTSRGPVQAGLRGSPLNHRVRLALQPEGAAFG